MKVAVVGAGAVGSYYGAVLARAGHSVMLIGRPAHVEAVRRSGLLLESAAFSGHVPLDAHRDPRSRRCGTRAVLREIDGHRPGSRGSGAAPGR